MPPAAFNQFPLLSLALLLLLATFTSTALPANASLPPNAQTTQTPTGVSHTCAEVHLRWACDARPECRWGAGAQKCSVRLTPTPTQAKACKDLALRWACLRRDECRWNLPTNACVNHNTAAPNSFPTPKPTPKGKTTKSPSLPPTAPSTAPRVPCRDEKRKGACNALSYCAWKQNSCQASTEAPSAPPSVTPPTHKATRAPSAAPTHAVLVPCRTYVHRPQCVRDTHCYWNGNKCVVAQTTPSPSLPSPTHKPSTFAPTRRVPTLQPHASTMAPTAPFDCHTVTDFTVCQATASCHWANAKCRPIK